MTPTLSQIAADVRRLAPEHLSETAVTCCKDTLGHTRDELARLALIGAMSLACKASRLAPCDDGWVVPMDEANADKDICRYDVDHGNDPMLSLHAAFLWAKGGGK